MDKLIALKIPGISGTPTQVAVEGIPSGSRYSIGFLATSFLEVAMVIGMLLSLIYLVFGGFYWIQSKGNKETLDKARRIIVYSIIGLIIMSLSLVIVNVVSSSLGIKSLIDRGTQTRTGKSS